MRNVRHPLISYLWRRRRACFWHNEFELSFPLLTPDIKILFSRQANEVAAQTNHVREGVTLG